LTRRGRRALARVSRLHRVRPGAGGAVSAGEWSIRYRMGTQLTNGHAANSPAPGRTGEAGFSLGRKRSGDVVVKPDPEGAAKPSRSDRLDNRGVAELPERGMSGAAGRAERR
jgi:hypothetical protein